jgi:hypothetical protein
MREECGQVGAAGVLCRGGGGDGVLDCGGAVSSWIGCEEFWRVGEGRRRGWGTYSRRMPLLRDCEGEGVDRQTGRGLGQDSTGDRAEEIGEGSEVRYE